MALIAINENINGSVVVAENGKILFALQEERVNRIKEFHGFPHQALDLAFEMLDLDRRDVSHVSFSNLSSPILPKEEFMAVYEKRASRGWEFGWPSLVRRLKEGLRTLEPSVSRNRRRSLRTTSANQRVEGFLIDHGLGHAKVVRNHHHFHHAASAYFGCRRDPWEKHLVLSLDGGGDDACAHIYLAEKGELNLVATTPLGHSIGNIYAAVTQIMGMRPHEHEYKLMGLAAYSDPSYTQQVAQQFSTYLDLDSHNPLNFKRRTPEPTFEIQRRLIHDFEMCRFDNLAGGLQSFTENLLVRWVQAAVKYTGVHSVVAAGGVFMNVKANGCIAALPEVHYFDVFPSCGDETLPFGAAWSIFANKDPAHQAELGLDHLYLGPDGGYDLAIVRERFAEIRNNGSELIFEDIENINQRIAELLASGKIVARCSNAMEFGARALGNRSILADPTNPRVVPKINKMIKKRDFWMPFAPAILRENADQYLTIPACLPSERVSPYMMHTFVTNDTRDDFIAGVHQHDLTTRAQIVCREANPEFYDLIERFRAITGRGVVLNTSFNLHGWPIVMGAADAVGVLLDSGLTHLVVNNTLIRKVERDHERYN